MSPRRPPLVRRVAIGEGRAPPVAAGRERFRVAVSQVSRAATAPVGFMQSDRMVLALLALLAVAVRFITYGNPALGFDEQFYLLVGDRMVRGELPYVDIFDRKPIGIFLIYAGIRWLGGEGFVQYKLVATLFVIATAWLIYLLARQRAERFGAGLAAALYILWLNLMEGEGGQTPVFYNLLVVGAAWQLFAAMRGPERLVPRGALALLLIGLALAQTPRLGFRPHELVKEVHVLARVVSFMSVSARHDSVHEAVAALRRLVLDVERAAHEQHQEA